MDLKGAVADHMGHFSLYDIPGVLFVLLAATLIGYGVAWWGAGLRGADARQIAFWATAAALATALVRSQLPVAALVLAAAVIVGKRGPTMSDGVVLFSALAVGIGCGSGATIVVGLAMIPYLPLMRWALRPTAAK